MDLRIEGFEHTNCPSDFNEHILDYNHFEKSSCPLSSSFNPNSYEQNENDKSLDDELVEIENEFQNICLKYTISKEHILNEKLFRSNNLK